MVALRPEEQAIPPLTGSHNTPKRRVMSNLTPAPGTPQTATKAYVSAAVSFLAAFVLSLWATLQDRTTLDGMTVGQWVLVLLGSLAGAIVSYGATYQAKNRAL